MTHGVLVLLCDDKKLINMKKLHTETMDLVNTSSKKGATFFTEPLQAFSMFNRTRFSATFQVMMTITDC